MSKHKPVKRKGGTGRLVVGALLFVLASLILVSLVTHSALDDARLRGDVDSRLNPFTDIQFHNQAGISGAFLSWVFGFLFGWLAYFIPASLLILSLRLFSSELTTKMRPRVLVLLVLSLLVTMIHNIELLSTRMVAVHIDAGGGYLGEELTRFSLTLFGRLGSYIVLGGILLIVAVAFTPLGKLLSLRMRLDWISSFHFKDLFKRSWEKLVRAAKSFFKSSTHGHDISGVNTTQKERVSIPATADLHSLSVDSAEKEHAGSDRMKRPGETAGRSATKKPSEPIKVKSLDYSYPTVALLNSNYSATPSVTAEELSFTARILQETLETFDVRVQGSISSFPGPVITRYEFKPAAGIKVNRILSLADDLALALKARRIRIIAPIPGKAAVGVEIPNRHPQTVFLKEILESDEFIDSKHHLPLALGKTTAGKPFVADLAKMPHLLIAGATGSGKSVCMNVLITSLIYRLHPLQVRFILIDPKMLELSVYRGIPHLGRPVVTKPKRAEKVFSDAVIEMEKRYRKLANAGVRNIEDFNSRQSSVEDKLPYIVIFVDELADLMMSSTSSKTELLITRLAQMARAVGIHLILATQRPSVDVITGLIKANFPARIAFQVSSKVDSRTIIDANGAERLLGNGDMLFMNSGQPDPSRIHGAFIDSKETEQLVSFINDQGLPMQTLERISQATGEVTETEVDLGDPLFREACEVVIRHKQGSVSLLQRRLGIGYQRAARLIDKLEQAGIVSPFDGSKARDVLVDQSYLETILSGAPRQTSEPG